MSLQPSTILSFNQNPSSIKQKNKTIASLESKLQTLQGRDQARRKITIVIFVHLIVLIICIGLGLFYGSVMGEVLKKPSNCLLSSLSAQYGLKNICQLCSPGFITEQQSHQCIPDQNS